MRRAIARRMTESKQQIPHFYLSTEIEMDALLDMVAAATNEDARARSGSTVTAFLLRAVALTLAEHPAFNAAWDGDRLERWTPSTSASPSPSTTGSSRRRCSIAAIATSRISPRGSATWSTRTRAGKLRAAEVSEGTFTLSNLGMYDVTAFTAIITPPQVAILATARTVERPVARDGQIVARQGDDRRRSRPTTGPSTGSAAAGFLGTLKRTDRGPGRWAEVAALTLLAGAAEVDITPPFPVDLLGYVRRPLAARSAYEPLMATACRLPRRGRRDDRGRSSRPTSSG